MDDFVFSGLYACGCSRAVESPPAPTWVLRSLLVERPGVLEWIARELEAEPAPDLGVVRVVAKGGGSSGPVDVVTVAQLRAGKPEALRLAAADWVLVGDDLIADVADLLPSNLLVAEELTGASGRLPRATSCSCARRGGCGEPAHCGALTRSGSGAART